ncbi:MAG: hypothetical protein CVV29_11240, partial [Methanobacteriales archaeon HGW-Methanobacteriales-2]
NLNGFNIYNNGQDGIYAPGHNVNITGSTLTDNGGNGISVTGDNEYIYGNTVTNKGNIGISVIGDYAIVSNNIVTNSIENGISITGKYAVVSGNTVTNNKKDGILVTGDYAHISGNTVTHNGGNGINVQGKTAVVNSNPAVTNNGGNGILITGDYAYVSGNTVNSNGNYYSAPIIPSELMSQSYQELSNAYTIFKEKIKLFNSRLYNSTFMGELGVTLMEFFTDTITEMVSVPAALDYISTLSSIYGSSNVMGSIENKLNSLSYGNGITVIGDHANVTENFNVIDNSGFGISVTGVFGSVSYNIVTYNGGGISVQGDNNKIDQNTANYNHWVGIYVNGIKNNIYYSQCNDNLGIGIYVSGQNRVIGSVSIDHNGLDGIVAHGDLSADIQSMLDPLVPFPSVDNVIFGNELSNNGGNGIFCDGNPVISENMGSSNGLFGTLIAGNPLTLLVLPNPVEGNLGAELPPMQLIAIPADIADVIQYVVGAFHNVIVSDLAGNG